LCLSRDRPSSTEAEEHDETVRRSRDRIVEVKTLAKKLLQHLSETVDACEEFCNHHLKYFHGGRSLHAIGTTFFELAALKKRLQSSAESCDEFAQEVSSYQSILLHTFPQLCHARILISLPIYIAPISSHSRERSVKRPST